MALITNNISGSSSDSWRIGITGSVRIANPGAGAFPAMPGTDVDFFVSGSQGGKGTSGVSVFGGDAVISGTLVVGTGSVTIDSNEIRFLGGAAKIFSGSGGLTFADSGNAGVTLTSLVAGGATAAGSDTQVQFNDGGSAFGASADFKFAKTTGVLSVANLIVSGTGNSLVSSGTIRVKDGSGTNKVILTTAGDVTGSNALFNGTISATGVISGSSNLLAGGDLTIAGDANVNGGDLITTATIATVFNTNATTVNIAGAATTVSLGAGSGTTTVNNGLTVKGDLTVQGTTTTIDTQNLLVKDAIIVFASGTAGPNKDGGIAIFSGSADGTDMVFGRIGNDTWGVGTLDTQNGTVASLTSMTPAALRASTFQVGGSSSTLTRDGTQLILSGNVVAISGSSVNFSADGAGIATVSSAGLLPQADVTYNLGSPSKRWQNIYTGDLHLRNDRGDYTLIEETDTLTIRFNKTGKRYRFVLERAPEFDEEPL